MSNEKIKGHIKSIQEDIIELDKEFLALPEYSYARIQKREAIEYSNNAIAEFKNLLKTGE